MLDQSKALFKDFTSGISTRYPQTAFTKANPKDMSKTNPAPQKQKAIDLMNSPVKNKFKQVKSSGYGAASSPKTSDTAVNGIISQKQISNPYGRDSAGG